jgi:hypothetical protein
MRKAANSRLFVGLGDRRLNVTRNPTAEWVARHVAEAFPWDDAPKYLMRDRDQIYGAAVTRRLRARFEFSVHTVP